MALTELFLLAQADHLVGGLPTWFWAAVNLAGVNPTATNALQEGTRCQRDNARGYLGLCRFAWAAWKQGRALEDIAHWDPKFFGPPSLCSW